MAEDALKNIVESLVLPLQSLRELMDNTPPGELAARLGTLLRDHPEILSALALLLAANKEEPGSMQCDPVMGKVFSVIAHDMRNSMSIIAGYVRLIEKSSVAVDERSANGFVVIQRELQRLTDLANDFSDFGKSTWMLDENPVSLTNILLVLKDELDPVVTKYRLKLQLDIDGNAHESFTNLALDGPRLRRVLVNLVRNACIVSAPQGGSTITVRLRRDGDHARLQIIDSGPSLSAEERNRMFQLGVGYGRGTATGIELIVARRFAERYGGTLTLEVLAEGGMMFEFRLPLIKAQAQSAA